ncbi:hypothetical protein ACOSQ4_026618 [Xanthoceras sorbifolium]
MWTSSNLYVIYRPSFCTGQCRILDIGPNLNITEAQILHGIGFTAPASRGRLLKLNHTWQH